MIYADNAATTKMSPVALAAMLPALEDNYGNPSQPAQCGPARRRAAAERP